MPSGKSISLYISDEESKRIMEYASERKITCSKFCRQAIQKELSLYSNKV